MASWSSGYKGSSEWTPQFLGTDGTLLVCGKLAQDEVPYGSATCLICGGGNLGAVGVADRRPSLIPHIAEPAHLEQQARVREQYHCFYQELRAPDGRPYWYDHVKHSWTFHRPKSLKEERGEGPILEPDEELRRRIQRQLYFADGVTVETPPSGSGWTVVEQSGRRYRCDYCMRTFGDEGSVQQHIASMAGRGNHPAAEPVAGASSWGAAASSPPPRPAQAAAPAAQPPAPAAQPMLSAEGDVQQVERDGAAYWYNPRTLATAWTKEDLIRKNTEFYYCLSQSFDPATASTVWRFRDREARVHAAPSLHELCELAGLR